MLNSLIPNFVKTVEGRLPQGTLREVTSKYLEEPRGLLNGNNSSILALPRTTKEASIIVKACQKEKISIIPYSGGTGLVGGQVDPRHEASVILSTERMKNIRDFYVDEKVIIVESGVILEHLQEEVSKNNLLFPLALASQGSCRIGGNLATNAGGVQVLKYGNIRDFCLGVEAVLPNGEIFNGLNRLRKDNTGYDLKNLLIGSEGTLGLITAASFRLFPKPNQVCTAILDVKSPSEALELLNFAQEFMDERVSSFELIGRKAVEFVTKCLPEIKVPISAESEWFVLIESTSSSDKDIHAKFEQFMHLIFDKKFVQDGVIAQSEAQRRTFWKFRESIPEANRLVGSIGSTDISLPLGEIAEFIKMVSHEISLISDCQINCFGHVGDGNLHFNLFRNWDKTKSSYDSIAPKLTNLIYDEVVKRNGSISAEHGIGRLNKARLLQSSDKIKIETMKAIKSAIDPNGIFNPGALIDL